MRLRKNIHEFLLAFSAMWGIIHIWPAHLSPSSLKALERKAGGRTQSFLILLRAYKTAHILLPIIVLYTKEKQCICLKNLRGFSCAASGRVRATIWEFESTICPSHVSFLNCWKFPYRHLFMFSFLKWFQFVIVSFVRVLQIFIFPILHCFSF